MADQKISELPVIPLVTGDDTSILVSNQVNYQYSFRQLCEYLTKQISTGSTLYFVNNRPQNSTGKDNDVAIDIDNNIFYQKRTGDWVNAYTLPDYSDAAGTKVLFGTGEPGYNSGQVNDVYIDSTGGSFYKKSAAGWNPVFSMLNGPPGGPGPKGDTGTPGAAGKTILSGSGKPSNIQTGTNGDFYIDTSMWVIYGPKADDIWPDGTPMIFDNEEIGDLEDLHTNSKSNLVAAINELVDEGKGLSGNTTNLTLDVPFGALAAGQSWAVADELIDMFSPVVTKTFYPTITEPGLSGMSNSAPAFVEVGRIINFNLVANLNQGSITASWPGGINRSRTGNATMYRFYNAVNTLLQQQVGNIFALNDHTVVAGPNLFRSEIDFAAGPQPVNSKGGTKDQNGNEMLPLPGDTTAKAPTSFTGVYPALFGTSDNNNGFDVAAGTRIVQQAGTPLGITFGASTPKYLWFAHEASSLTKTDWYVDALNKGKIGGADNLFASPITLTVTAPATTGFAGWQISYKLYITNFKTTTSGAMTLS
jgi:hypothetical protein